MIGTLGGVRMIFKDPHAFSAIFNCDIFIGAAIYSSDEDESDFETRHKKKPDRTKVLRALRDSDEESDESDKKATSGNESNAKSHSASGSDSG